jgi:hypothetical protein
VRREERDPREEMGQGKREPVRERGRGGAGSGQGEGLGCLLLFLLLSFFLSTLKPLKQIHLNSNKFEFKINNSTQIKQCSSMNAQAS